MLRDGGVAGHHPTLLPTAGPGGSHVPWQVLSALAPLVSSPPPLLPSSEPSLSLPELRPLFLQRLWHPAEMCFLL